MGKLYVTDHWDLSRRNDYMRCRSAYRRTQQSLDTLGGDLLVSLVPQGVVNWAI